MLISMQTSIRQRVKAVMDHYELNPHSMALKLKTSDTNVRNYISDRDAPHEFLLNITRTFVEVNPEWLLTGVGTFKREKYQKKFIEERIDELQDIVGKILKKVDIEEKGEGGQSEEFQKDTKAINSKVKTR